MLSSHIDMDELFDLDMALTMPAESTNRHHEPDTQSAVAARHMVDEMPTVVMVGGRDCSVCLEGFGVGGAGKKVPCGHVFHENCILHWLSVHDSCPLCRRKLAVSGKPVL
ncbi:hypothetical protein CASFOL_032515 [Castilleja foliolosa]|uniref:RING-type domain-containing protein n=1 Tax=Castilleja foliolosa TaxID=1961234 RepID=A0ABD3C291_9LAMI